MYVLVVTVADRAPSRSADRGSLGDEGFGESPDFPGGDEAQGG